MHWQINHMSPKVLNKFIIKNLTQRNLATHNDTNKYQAIIWRLHMKVLEELASNDFQCS